jgi:hypothetical protein
LSMSTRKYTERQIVEWCIEHFPPINSDSENVELESKLRDVLIGGSLFFDKYPISTNRTLHNLKPENRYRRYFTNRAELDSLGFENFEYLCACGGRRYTNEFIYTTLLREYVDDAVVSASTQLLGEQHNGEPT